MSPLQKLLMVCSFLVLLPKLVFGSDANLVQDGEWITKNEASGCLNKSTSNGHIVIDNHCPSTLMVEGCLAAPKVDVDFPEVGKMSDYGLYRFAIFAYCENKGTDPVNQGGKLTFTANERVEMRMNERLLPYLELVACPESSTIKMQSTRASDALCFDYSLRNKLQAQREIEEKARNMKGKEMAQAESLFSAAAEKSIDQLQTEKSEADEHIKQVQQTARPGGMNRFFGFAVGIAGGTRIMQRTGDANLAGQWVTSVTGDKNLGDVYTQINQNGGSAPQRQKGSGECQAETQTLEAQVSHIRSRWHDGQRNSSDMCNMLTETISTIQSALPSFQQCDRSGARVQELQSNINNWEPTRRSECSRSPVNYPSGR